jgi:hypothetical protein
MLTHFLTFEIRYWLRSWMLWIFLLVIALLSLRSYGDGPGYGG